MVARSGILGRKYLFSDGDDEHQLRLEQRSRIFRWHFVISENGAVVGKAGTNAVWSKGFLNIRDLCQYEIPFGHGFRTDFGTTTTAGEQIGLSLKGLGWEAFLPSALNVHRVVAGLALLSIAYMSRD